jgi:tartrate dehydratase beta subunit/fumarate hydratase class I family protein
MKEVKLSTALREEDIRDLRIGDVVYISGIICTSRDMGHLKMIDVTEKSEKLPIDFQGGAIFHAGPVVKKQGDKYEVVVIGPTTSIRMEPYSDFIGGLGVKAIIGKGGMEEGTSEALKKYGMVYLQLGVPEALWVLEVENFGPLVVGMDSEGNSIYRDIKIKGKELIEKMF